jgi:hypothetical protein
MGADGDGGRWDRAERDVAGGVGGLAVVGAAGRAVARREREKRRRVRAVDREKRGRSQMRVLKAYFRWPLTQPQK